MTAGNSMHGEYKIPGGKLVVADVAIIDGRLARVQVSGDFFLEPASALDIIDSALEGMSCESDHETLAAKIRTALGPIPQLFGITPEGVAIAIRRAIDADERSSAGGCT